MKEYQTKDIRNIALVGHGGEGKTTLVEAILYTTGLTDRMGRVAEGTSSIDYDPEEVKRGISISLGLAPIEWKNSKINLIDVPGYFDMVGELGCALHAVEGALIMVNAVSGLAVGGEKAWDACQEHGVATGFVINQMDRENANFPKVLAELQEKYGTNVVPLQMPILEDGAFVGYADLVKGKAYRFQGKDAVDTEVPSDMQDELESLREALVEGAAMADDALMEKFFEDGTLSDEDVLDGLRKGIRSGTVNPVVCASGFENKGTYPLLNMLVDFMPSPADTDGTPAIDVESGEEIIIKADDAEKFSALVFKTISDNFVGKLSLFKIMSGTLSSTDYTPLNTNSGKMEKVASLGTMLGKKQIPISVMHAGDIGVLAKLAATSTGDTLCSKHRPVKFPPIQFPEPSVTFAVSAAKQGEEDKVFGGLARLQEEDPSFVVGKNPDTGESIISGQGELHLDIVVSKLASKFNVKAQLNDPKIPYRETIRKAVKVQGRHKKQSGGHGQFGDIWVEFEPITDGSSEFEFVDKVVGGSVPRQYIPAVEKGLRDCINHGVLAGYPVVNLRASLVDGSYHPVDSSEMAFKTAASLAFKKGMADANPVLLEPIMKVEVLVPDEYMGDVIGDLNRRRGRIMGMNPVKGQQEVVGEVPMAEMFKYATDLRSMTQARGSFKMTFDHYEEMPSNIAAKVIEEAKKSMTEDDDD